MRSFRPIGLLVAGLTAALVAALLVGCTPNDPQIWTTADCAPAPPSFGDAPCGSLGYKLRSLVAGDTLRIQPGTYEIGKMRIDNMPGTSGSKGRILITADDADNPPILDGWLSLWGADWVVLDNLIFYGTETTSNSGGPAGGLSYTCGTNNTVKNSEFYGANETASLWNLGIGGNKSGSGAANCPNEPSGLTISNNIFRLPYTDGSTATIYHHIYAFFEGDAGTSATITRNIFHGFKNGAGIKIGTSSDNSGQNVTISFNTFYDGTRAILLEDLVKGTIINGNLIDKIVYAGSINPHIPVALGNVTAQTPENIISHTYAANNKNPNHLVFGPILNGMPGVLTDGGDNPYRAINNPNFNSTDPTVPGAFQPGNAAAQPYGVYGTGNFP
jgi:hypothetical protein